ncbi:MAG: metal-dependent hydrolase [Thaumarchaeota archaeon]|nr:metal-dependent hydrolase [Nitrososphaerota archaeon]
MELGRASTNFPTHVMFGIVVGAVFFGKPEIILLMGIGSAIPDLDREYGFLSKESFTRRQVHRALAHNFLFLGVVYLINPYLGLGAFLHTFLDALTTARDRGVEWLYPFTRLVNRAAYDYNGNRIDLDPKHKIYLLQNELPVLTKKTTKDLKPGDQTQPWRRTYGPALSGGLLDKGIFLGSVAITLLLILFSALGLQQFIDLTGRPFSLPFALPFAIGSVGVVINFVEGEIDRKQLTKKFKPDRIYKALFYLSIGIMIFAVILGGTMNPEVVLSSVNRIPYVATGIALVILIAFVVLKASSSKPLPTDPTKEPVIV